MAISFVSMILSFKDDFKIGNEILIFLNNLGLVIKTCICEEGPFVFNPNPTKIGAFRGWP